MYLDTKTLLLKTQKQVYSQRLGNHISKFYGEGFEFGELREYMYGDDVRKIDWKTTAKMGKPFVKIYHEERELNVAAATMMGGSSYFGTVKQKSEVMREVVALIGMSALSQNDRFSHFLFADKLVKWNKPSKKTFSLFDALEQMDRFEILGAKSNYQEMTQTLWTHLNKKAMLYIISDGIGEIDLGKLSKKHDVVLIIIRDRFEENPQELGLIQLIDMESGQGFFGNVDSDAISNYRKSLAENDAILAIHCKKYGIRMLKVYTHEDVYLKLLNSIC
ncbi:MAG: DUF58 domain-containing protein [Sulfurovaceae bacterium]|nr:DUF58 domain-containing protein [Sulfurovaceae bacterium]